jgi:hypothetical protein
MRPSSVRYHSIHHHSIRGLGSAAISAVAIGIDIAVVQGVAGGIDITGVQEACRNIPGGISRGACRHIPGDTGPFFTPNKKGAIRRSLTDAPGQAAM